MDKLKGMDGQVEKVIDQAADMAKKKVNTMIGGKKEAEEGIGGALSGAAGQAEKAAEDAAGKAKSFGKGLLK